MFKVMRENYSFCKIILKWIYRLERRCCSKFLPSFSSGRHLVQWSGTVLAILVQVY